MSKSPFGIHVASVKMTYLQHLEELRRRIIVCVAALAAGIGVSWVFAWDILYVLKRPAGNISLNYLKPLEPFMVRFKMAMFGGVILALPVILMEILAFVAPALKENERKYTILVTAMIVLFFGAGVVFGYYFIMPVGIKWLLDIAGSQMTAVLSATEYVSFVGWFMIAFGVAFETPMFIWMLVALGVLTPEQLREQWRYAYLIILVFSAVVTPDWNPVTMLLVAAPMIVLYELSIIFARLTIRRRGKLAEAAG